MDIISYDEFIKEITNNKSVFLCGNGFSINFDKRFRWDNLMSLLYSTHETLVQRCDFDVFATLEMNTVATENFKNTLHEVSKLNTEEKFESIFEEAAIFAHSVFDNSQALKWFQDNGDSTLTFGLKISDLLEAIVKQADVAEFKKSISVNYEYWTILIYFVNVMQNAPTEIYNLDDKNIFVQLALTGGKYSLQKSDLRTKVITNGLYTYFRFLFAGNILLQGDAFYVKRLENWNTLDLNVIYTFLNRFDHLLTTNYDRILEQITHREISHLHGYYAKIKKRVLDMSLGMLYSSARYDLSTIIIGDYFISKTIYQTSAKLSSYKSNNTNIEIYDDVIKKAVEVEKSNVIVIFGLSVDNDYHIIRSIQAHHSKVPDPHLIYCFFTEKDKNDFWDVYVKCMTYSPELNEAVKRIKVSFVKSQDIIKNIFEQ